MKVGVQYATASVEEDLSLELHQTYHVWFSKSGKMRC